MGVRTFHEVNTNNIFSLVLDTATIRITPKASRVRIHEDYAAINKVTDSPKKRKKKQKKETKEEEILHDRPNPEQRRFLTVVQLRNDG